MTIRMNSRSAALGRTGQLPTSRILRRRMSSRVIRLSRLLLCRRRRCAGAAGGAAGARRAPAVRRRRGEAEPRAAFLRAAPQLLDADVERELVHPQILRQRRGNQLDFDELGLPEPGRRVEVAHQRRDPCARLRVAHERDLGADLLQRLQVDPVRELAHHLIQHMDGFGPVGLQRFDDLLPGEERLRLLAELVDLLDLLVELRDLGLEQGCCGPPGPRSARRGSPSPAPPARGP